MPIIRTGDGEIISYKSYKQTINNKGVPGYEFELFVDDRIISIYIKDELEINQSSGCVIRFFENVFIKPINTSHTIWFCVLNFNHGRTQLSDEFEKLNSQLLDVYKRIARTKQTVMKKEDTIRKLSSQPHEAMKEEIQLREIAGKARNKSVDDYMEKKLFKKDDTLQ